MSVVVVMVILVLIVILSVCVSFGVLIVRSCVVVIYMGSVRM